MATKERFKIFDSGGVGDRYTVLDSKPDAKGWRIYLGMNAHPFHPQGIGMHGGFSRSDYRNISRSSFRNLGKKISILDLPPDAQKAAIQFISHMSEG